MRMFRGKTEEFNQRTRERGSVLLEACIVFPVMFFVILIIIYVGNVYYQKAQIDDCVERAAIKGAACVVNPQLYDIWGTNEVPMEIGNSQPYRYIFGEATSGASLNKLEKDIGDGLLSDINNNVISFFIDMEPQITSSGDSLADFKNYVIYGVFKTSVTYTIKMSGNWLLTDGYLFKFKSHAEVAVTDVPEFIRNVDMIMDMFAGTELGNKISSVFKKVNDFIKMFAGESPGGGHAPGGDPAPGGSPETSNPPASSDSPGKSSPPEASPSFMPPAVTPTPSFMPPAVTPTKSFMPPAVTPTPSFMPPAVTPTPSFMPPAVISPTPSFMPPAVISPTPSFMPPAVITPTPSFMPPAVITPTPSIKPSDKKNDGDSSSNLLDELANSGVKYNANDVVVVMKNTDGKLMWLENGNKKAGLTHIIERHASDFEAQGVSDIPKFLENVVSTKPVNTGSNAKGLYSDYQYNGHKYRVAYGTNGFVVSFYPID